MNEVDRLNALIALIREMYGEGQIPLHRPIFSGREREYLVECIDSNFVSSVGARVSEFEEKVAAFVGAQYAVATMNGTAALHIGLLLAGVRPGDEVITQALTFVATCNAIVYAGATPVFVDTDRDSMGMSPVALSQFLEMNTMVKDGVRVNRRSGRRIACCLPMHTFGHPCRIEEIAETCLEFEIPLIEDAAESLGSYSGEHHTGTSGLLGTLSFNGNKIITTGGGGMIVTNNAEVAQRAKHFTTTAKIPHEWEYVHDRIGYNYRLPNLNAALGCAQLEQLSRMLEVKHGIAERYAEFCSRNSMDFVGARPGTRPNFWLNAVLLDSRKERDEFLAETNAAGVMTRPIWRLMSRLKMYQTCEHDDLENSCWLEERVVNLPSSVPESSISGEQG